MINEVLLNEVPNVCQCNPSLISTLQVIVETHNYCNVPVYYTNNTSWNFVKILYPWYWSFSSTSSTFALPSGGSANQLEKQNCVSYIGKKDIQKKTYCTWYLTLNHYSFLYVVQVSAFSRTRTANRECQCYRDGDRDFLHCSTSQIMNGLVAKDLLGLLTSEAADSGSENFCNFCQWCLYVHEDWHSSSLRMRAWRSGY